MSTCLLSPCLLKKQIYVFALCFFVYSPVFVNGAFVLPGCQFLFLYCQLLISRDNSTNQLKFQLPLLYLKAKIIIGDTKAMTYKVYISFHKDEDTIRYSFLSHLSASLRRKGLISSSSFVHNSSNEIKREKKNFKAFLVVISWKYVLSAECLDELAEIVDQNVVVPVFYCITQSDVEHQCRLDILRHTFPVENYSAERVARWIDALTKTTESYKLR